MFLDGHKKSIKANIEQLSGYSAHADQKGLLDWVKAMGDMPAEIYLVHGEYTAKQSLKLALREIGVDKQRIVG